MRVPQPATEIQQRHGAAGAHDVPPTAGGENAARSAAASVSAAANRPGGRQLVDGLSGIGARERGTQRGVGEHRMRQQVGGLRTPRQRA